MNQWEALTEYGQSKGHINPYLVLECAWRISNWTAMKEALVQVGVLPLCPGGSGLIHDCTKCNCWKAGLQLLSMEAAPCGVVVRFLVME